MHLKNRFALRAPQKQICTRGQNSAGLAHQHALSLSGFEKLVVGAAVLRNRRASGTPNQS
jgi:hypothetical protein